MLNLRGYRYIEHVATSMVQGSQSSLNLERIPRDIPEEICHALFSSGFHKGKPLSAIHTFDWLNKIKDTLQITHKAYSPNPSLGELFFGTISTERAKLEAAYIASIKQIDALIDIERAKIIAEGTIFNKPSESVTVNIQGLNIACSKMAFSQSKPLRKALQADLESPVKNFEEQTALLTSILESAAYTEKTETSSETQTLITVKKVTGVSLDQTIQKVMEGKFHKRVLEHVLSQINALQHPIDDQLKQTLQKLIDNYEPPHFSKIIHELTPEVISTVLYYLHTGEKEIREDFKTEFSEACALLELPDEEEIKAFLKENTPQIDLPNARSLYKLEELQKKKLLEAAAEEERKTTSSTHLLKGVGDVTRGLLKIALATAVATISTAIFIPKSATFFWMMYYLDWEGAVLLNTCALMLSSLFLALGGLYDLCDLGGEDMYAQKYYKVPEIERHLAKLKESLRKERDIEKSKQYEKQIEKYELQLRDVQNFLWESAGKRHPHTYIAPVSPFGVLRSIYNDFASAAGQFQHAWEKMDEPVIEHG